jgi:hypothetical protein
MVDATILHLKQLRQVQQRRAPHSGVAFAWLKVKLAAKWVGDFCFSPSRLFFMRQFCRVQAFRMISTLKELFDMLFLYKNPR